MLSRVEALVSPLLVPGRPEHCYRCYPAKSEACMATTLAWIGDLACRRAGNRFIRPAIDSPGLQPARNRPRSKIQT